MPLIRKDDVERFVPPSDPDNWIDLKKQLTSGDDDSVWESLVQADAKVRAGDDANDVRIAFRVTALNRERVRRSIVAWSFVEDGVAVPVSAENIDRLDRATFAAVVERVDALNPLGEMNVPTLPTASSSRGSAVMAAPQAS